jgi:hypothetical protein
MLRKVSAISIDYHQYLSADSFRFANMQNAADSNGTSNIISS